MITNPISYAGTAAEILVTEYASSTGRADYWLEVEVGVVRRIVKAYYIGQQTNRCCYCDQRILSGNGRHWDVEHIVPRSRRPDFMFEPKNLAIACPECNAAKGNKQTMTNPRLRGYPRRSEAFKIVHPHFDEFDTHIARAGIIYLPKTDKGRWTLYNCNLMRYAQDFMNWEDDLTDDRFEDEIRQLRLGGANAADALAAIIPRIVRSQRRPAP